MPGVGVANTLKSICVGPSTFVVLRCFEVRGGWAAGRTVGGQPGSGRWGWTQHLHQNQAQFPHSAEQLQPAFLLNFGDTDPSRPIGAAAALPRVREKFPRGLW